VKEYFTRIKTYKALGPDDILIEVWRCFEDVAIVWLTKLFNIFFGPIRYLMSGEEIY
jgi:hypothetical protein